MEATLRLLTSYYNAGNGRGPEPARPGDELVLELKRLVRSYADELRQIHQFAPGEWDSESGQEDKNGR